MASKKHRRTFEEDGKVFVLKNVPANYKEDLIIDYIESTLDIDVKEVKLHPSLPGRALLYLDLQLEDFSEANVKIGKGSFECNKVKLLVATRQSAVVVTNIDIKKLSKEFLCLYFESEFADGCEAIESSKVWPELNIAIVHFHPHYKTVVDKILERSDLVPLPSEDYHISIQPFYQSFHEYIGQQIIQNEEVEAAEVEKEYLAVDDSSAEEKDNKEESDEEDEVESEGEDEVESEEEDEEEKEEDEEGSEAEVEDDNEEQTKSDTESENKTDSDEDSNTEEEGTNVKTVTSQAANREKRKDAILHSKRESATIRGGFRGRGIGGINRGRAAPSRRGSYTKKGERNEEHAFTSRDDKNTFDFNQVNFSTEGVDSGTRLKKQHSWGRGRMGGRGGEHNYGSIFPQGTSSNVETQSEDNLFKIYAKQQISHGRGSSTFYLPEGAKRVASTSFLGSPNDRGDISENQGYEDLHHPRSSIPGICISKSDKPHDNQTNVHVSQSLPEQNDSFKKVQLENKEKYDKELAAKEAKIKQLEEELAKKNEQPKRCTETINMTIWQQEFLPHSFGNFEGCLIKFDQHANIAILEGEYESVKEHQLKLLKELKKLKEGLLALTPAMCTILSKDQGKQYLHKLNSSHLNGAKVFLQDASLFVAAKDEESLNTAMEFLKARINYKETTESGVKLPIEKLISIQSKLENSFLVKVSWNDNDLVICVEGIKDDVFQSSSDIRTLMEEYGVHEKSFLVTGSHARFFHKNLDNEIAKCLQNVEMVDFTSTGAQVSIKYKGDKKTVNLVQRKLKELETKVTSKCWDLRSDFKKTEDLMLITKGFSSEKMKKKVDDFETKHKCIVITTLPSSETFSFRASKETKAARSVHVSPSKSRRKFTAAVPTQKETKLQFILNDTCQLVIKPYGDIIREPSDILVCVLDQNADLRKTRVGQTFNKVCRNLRKILEVEHAANPGAAVLTTQGQLSPLKCLAICHIIFTPWNPNSSPAHLSNAIQLVFGQAVALGAKSVSFPVLGCGRAFGFPASDVAQITLSSIKSSNLGNTIQKVVLLAPDEGLFKEFKKEAPKHFKSVPITVSGAVGGASSEKTITDETADDHEDDESDKSEDEPFVEILTPDLQGSSIGEISIVALHSNGLDNLWSNLKKEITNVCLRTKYFNQELTDFWPKESRKTILEEAKKLCVWVERSPNPKTNKSGYIIKGEKQKVEKMLHVIEEEFREFSSHLPKHRIKSDKAPRRGTQEFLKYAADSDEQFPSYWKLNSSKNYLKSMWSKLTSKISETEGTNLVDVDAKTKDAIKKLIHNTWNPNLVGQGNDAAGLTHRGFKIIDVKRIENMQLFEPYSMQRKMLFKRICETGRICPDIGKIVHSKGRVETTEKLEGFMKEELYYEINEHYLFHGTRFPKAIIANGIDPRVSSDGAMFGKGIYTAEMFTKSDQYTDSRNDRSPPGKQLTMILARVLLGNVFLCNEQHKSVANKQSVKLTRPPCMNCREDKCNCENQKLFDSVLGDGKWIFREFVVYDKSHCYPEYVIYYQRT